MQKQVDSRHYDFGRYMAITRWDSIWHQLKILSSIGAKNVLEAGPGPGYFKVIAETMGITVKTADIDPDLKPDHVGSVTSLPIKDAAYEACCAFQVLEHLPFEEAVMGLNELARVAEKNVIISLPDSRRTWRYMWHLPRLGERRKILSRPQLRAPVHEFDGEHYWELNKKGYELEKVLRVIREEGRLRLDATFRPFENPYHRFFIFSKEQCDEE